MSPAERTARKRHKCTLCGEPITPGSTYIFERITPWDHSDNDSYFSYKAHHICNEVWLEVCDDYDCIFPDNAEEWKQELIAQRPMETTP
jgi:hypothetical protein